MHTDILTGSCLCGEVRYEIHGPLGPIVHCHCSMCRKAQGSAFGTISPVPAASFVLLKGEHALKGYGSSPDKERIFCRHCGSPLFSRRKSAPGTIRLRVGTLDDPLPHRPAAHIFTASKASWHEITDELPQYPQLEPGR